MDVLAGTLGAATAPVDTVVVEPPPVRSARSIGDLVRVVLALIVLVVALTVVVLAPGTVSGVQSDVLDLFGRLPKGVQSLFVGVGQIIAIVLIPTYVVGMAVLRRWRPLLLMVTALLFSGPAMIVVGAILDRAAPVVAPDLEQPGGILAVPSFPTAQYLAWVTAVVTLSAPWLSRRWRRAMWTAIGILVAVRVVSATASILELVVAETVGWLIGSIVLVLWGGPSRRPAGAAVATAMGMDGTPVRRLELLDRPRIGPDVWQAEPVDPGPSLWVRVHTADDRVLDSLTRWWRRIRLRRPGDVRPFPSVRRAVEHEVLMTLALTRVGVTTPPFRSVAGVGDEAVLLATDEVIGARSGDSLSADELDDAVLDRVWGLVARLHAARIAHRDLRLGTVLLDAGGEPWLIDLGAAEVAATDAQQADDVVQLLASTALIVGPTRAVASAVRVLGAKAVTAALPRLQPLALRASTRRQLRGHRQLLRDLRVEVQAVTGVDDVRMEPLERIGLRTVLMLGFVAFALYALLPQLGGLGSAWNELGDAHLGWIGLMVVVALTTHLSSATSLIGAVPQPLPFVPTVAAQLASAFTNSVTPAGVGGMALNVRYLRKQGVEPAVATTSIGVNTVTGVVVHVLLLLSASVWAGRSDLPDVSFPAGGPVVIAIAALALAVVVAVVVPPSRRLIVARVRPFLHQAREGLLAVVQQPAKVAMLVLGSAGITVANTVALACAVQAFGGGVSLPALVVVYLAGSAVGQVAPTPGGLGAVEAALAAGLAGAGADQAVAIAAVLTFRAATFWLPILPGWGAVTWLQRTDRL